MTLAEFLLARIAEDEAVARRGYGIRDGLATVDFDEYGDVLVIGTERVLAECEAKRRIVELHDSFYGVCQACIGSPPRVGDVVKPALWPCTTLRLLALPFADHPDYREEWRP